MVDSTHWGSVQHVYYITSIDARLWRASLLRRIVDGASMKALKVCARFSVGIVSERELFLLSRAFGDQGRDWNALTHHFASEINISEHTSSASLVANAASNSLACFQVLEQRYELSEWSNHCCIYVAQGGQQLEAIIRKYGCPPRRKIPKVEGICHYNNGRMGVFDQWRSLSSRSSVIGERLVAFAAVV